MNKQIETLTKEVHAYQLSNKQQQVAAIRSDLCGEGHANGNFEEMKKSQDAKRKNNEASRKMLETQLGQLAKQLAEQNKGGFSGNTKENSKNESYNAIELRSKKVFTPLVPKVPKKVDEEVVEKDGDKPQVVPSYVKLAYPRLAKKKMKEEGQFKKFMELFSQLQVNIPFGEALNQMPLYAKFMKELLTGRKRLKDDENIVLPENCSAI
ncbi:hypothetical protein MTR_0035s0100 [Medicago truncatula]|uniref:Uncharacterized protein n=1 Tax=Medicago truncatula TaxID=3880 RepID=A0A072TIF5_MEDTR|nr:hypothetical protein MTR_0035s0100 [Medicago truncatula]